LGPSFFVNVDDGMRVHLRDEGPRRRSSADRCSRQRVLAVNSGPEFIIR
jgi:hypothetical protein